MRESEREQGLESRLATMGSCGKQSGKYLSEMGEDEREPELKEMCEVYLNRQPAG